MTHAAGDGPTLVVRHTGQVFPLTHSSVTIGRQPDNIIVLSDPKASRRHAIIYWEEGDYVIHDLGSANGTYVNERAIVGPQKLGHGYLLRIGNTVFDLKLAPGAATPARGAFPPAAAPPLSQPRPPSPGQPRRFPVWQLLLALLLLALVVGCSVVAAFVLFPSLGDSTPAVVIQAPAKGAEIAAGNEIVLRATATGTEDIVRLELSLDGALIATASSPLPSGLPSLVVSQPWHAEPVGPHLLSAVAYTANGRTSVPVSQPFAVVDRPGGLPTFPPSASPVASPSVVVPPATAAPVATATSGTVSPTATRTPSSTPEPTPSPRAYPTPEITFFRANPATVVAGECSRLVWGAVTGATAAYIDHDIGGVATPGRRRVCPAQTTTYVMTATGPGGVVTASATVHVAVPQPDLVVEGITFLPTEPVQGEDNEVHITIRNIGGAETGPFDWQWQAGTAIPLGGTVANGLDAGEEIVVTAFWRPEREETNLPTTARVDAGQTVGESNEDNNQLTVNVQVQAGSSTSPTVSSPKCLACHEMVAL